MDDAAQNEWENLMGDDLILKVCKSTVSLNTFADRKAHLTNTLRCCLPLDH
jgi:hypothetical protein